MRKSVLIIFSLLICLLKLQATTFEVDGIMYEIRTTTPPLEVAVTHKSSYGQYSGDIVIPETVSDDTNTYQVTAIGNSAFSECAGLLSVVLPNTVTEIGDNAFSNCWVLKTIDLSSSINYIGENSFLSCSSLSTISLGNTLQKIGNQAFRSSGLTSITIPDSVKIIGSYAFGFCSKLTNITFNSELREISSWAFYSCSALTSVFLPAKLNKIGDNAFNYCSSLTTVDIPNSVQRIELKAFNLCRKLSSVTFGNGLKYIGDNAFYECSKLTSLEIPGLVETIGNSAFDGCTGIKIMKCYAIVPPKLGYYSFSALNIPVYVPVTSIDAYKADDNWKSFTNIQPATILDGINYKITSSTAPCKVEVSLHSLINSAAIEIPASVKFNNISYSVTGIADKAFEGYTDITSINLPNSLKYIGTEAFRNCTNLADITLSDSITRVGARAFNNTAWHNSQSGIAYLGKVLINSKHSLLGEPITVVVKEGTEVIAEDAFLWCIRMTNISLPASLKYIGSYAFSICSSLKGISCNAVTPPILGEAVFYGVNTSIPLTVPAQSIDLYKQQLQWQDFLLTADEKNTELKFSVFPNPATDYVFIDGINTGDNIVIYNSLGKVVFSTKSNSQLEKLDLRLLNEGYYIVCVFENSRMKISKKMIIKKQNSQLI